MRLWRGGGGDDTTCSVVLPDASRSRGYGITTVVVTPEESAHLRHRPSLGTVTKHSAQTAADPTRGAGDREASLAGHGQEAGSTICIYAMAAKRPYAV
jgi:hypothetical protein